MTTITELREQLAALRLKCDEAISACASETCAMAKKVAALTVEKDDYKKDAERYRWLRDTFHKAVGAGIEVNDDALAYQDCEHGEEVRLYWYPDTPIGFYESKASTIDAAIDAALAKHSPEDDIERARRMV